MVRSRGSGLATTMPSMVSSTRSAATTASARFRRVTEAELTARRAVPPATRSAFGSGVSRSSTTSRTERSTRARESGAVTTDSAGGRPSRVEAWEHAAHRLVADSCCWAAHSWVAIPLDAAKDAICGPIARPASSPDTLSTTRTKPSPVGHSFHESVSRPCRSCRNAHASGLSGVYPAEQLPPGVGGARWASPNRRDDRDADGVRDLVAGSQLGVPMVGDEQVEGHEHHEQGCTSQHPDQCIGDEARSVCPGWRAG